ncbi:MAG TPA: cyclic nucleotide-binding domain-containing protein [Candidatus Limnocylindrales bacterium]
MTGFVGRVRATLRVAAEVLHNPSLRRVGLAFLAFGAVEYGSWVAILLYAYEATGPASVGVVALVQLVPAALFAPPAATLSDRFRREKVLFVAYGLLALLTGLTGFGMLAGWPPLLVYAAAVSVVMPLSMIRPTHNALLPTLARSPSELTAANAATSIAEAAGLLLGPLTAAAILLFAVPGTVLAVMACVAGLGALLVAGLRPAGLLVASADDERDASTGLAVLGGFRALAADGDARLVVAILSARQLMIGVTDVLFVLLAIELYQTGDSGAAILSAAIGAGGIIGGAAAFGLIGRPHIAPVLLASGLLWGLTFAVIAFAPGAVAPLVLVVGGVGLAVMDVAGRTVLQRAVADEVLARVFGILEGLMMAALAVGSILVPVVVALAGLQWSVVVFAAMLPLLLLLTSPGLRSIDRRADVPVRAIGLLLKLRMFEVLDPPSLESLGRAASWLTVPGGTTIIREGDPGDQFYVLASGAVDVTRHDHPVRRLDAVGDGFGEIALLRDVPRTATITAAVETELLILGRREFLGAVTGHPVARDMADRAVDEVLRADQEAGEA